MQLAKNVNMIAAGATVCLALGAGVAFGLSGTAEALDASHLSKGFYTANAKMINVGTGAASMSDKALTKPIQIVVDSKGHYTAVVSMHGIQIYFGGKDNFGYLRYLRYMKNGTYTATTVENAYSVVDDFNKGDKGKAKYRYPEQISFPLVNKNLGDVNGYVDLQVFVPIMYSISPASGTQPVYMKINWNTLKKAEQASATSNGVTYTIKGSSATATGIGKGVKANNANKSLTMGSTVKFGGKNYKVTSVKASAFKNKKELTEVTVGKNVKTVGRGAFQGNEKLKTITFKGKSVKSIGKNAFKSIYKKATIKAPKKQLNKYKKLCKKAGAPKAVKYKAA